MASGNFVEDGKSRGKCDASVQTQHPQEHHQQQVPKSNQLTLIGTNKRSSFQDVEEALNSLLWQPYEYQITNRCDGDDGGDLDGPSANKDVLFGRYRARTSASSTSIVDERDEEDELPQVEEIIITDNDNSTSSGADLNLGTEMVNNLKATTSSGQCKRACKSREALSRNNNRTMASRLKSRASLLEELLGAGYRAGSSSTTGALSGEVSSGVGCCDVFLDNYFGDMQIEVAVDGTTTSPPPISGTTTTAINNNVLIVTGDGNNRYNRQNNAANLSSVNVVGLPPPNNAWISRTVPSNNNGVHHQKSKSQIEQTTRSLQVPQSSTSFTHYRSASVPKSMQIGPNQTQDLNVSNVHVNFYRAVPVNVVSSVPTIKCLNTIDNSTTTSEGNNVSSVQIMPLGSAASTGQTSVPPISGSTITGTTQVTVHASNNGTPIVRRTFTSTEAQTDDLLENPRVVNQRRDSGNGQSGTTADVVCREQRRRERRERKHHHQRRVNANQQRHISSTTNVDDGTRSDNLGTGGFHQISGGLPDLLNSHHLPPPYTPPPVIVPHPVGVLHHHQTVAPPPPPNVVPSGLVAFPPPPPPNTVPLVHQVAGGGPVAVPVAAAPSGLRFPFPVGGFRRGRFAEEPPKGCCGLLTWKPGSLRWFIAVIALVAVCCVLVGTALGAMRPSGRDHLTVSLLMIGVGIVLVTVSGIAWKLTSHDSSTCRSMLGLGSTESVDVCASGGGRRFVPRLPPSYGRPHHPYAAMMYPEFQYRPPPPSYQASMQEYRLRLLLLDRGNGPQMRDGIQNAVSPPPTYRSHAGSLLRVPLSSGRVRDGGGGHSEYSCPPSYHSQGSGNNRGGHLQSNSSVLHSREQSLTLSESIAGDNGNVVNVVGILGSTDEDIALVDDLALDSLKIEPMQSDISHPLRMLLKGSSCSDLDKDGNLVTIVQTNDQNPVIVTVSGSSHLDNNNQQHHNVQISSEMEVLAHL